MFVMAPGVHGNDMHMNGEVHGVSKRTHSPQHIPTKVLEAHTPILRTPAGLPLELPDPYHDVDSRRSILLSLA